MGELEGRRCRRGQVADGIDGAKLGEFFSHVAHVELMSGGDEVRHVRRVPRREVIEDDDVITSSSEGISEVRAEEPCPSSNDDSHGRPIPA